MPKPTKDDFKEGLRKVNFDKNQKRILLLHYCEPKQTRTVCQIAEWVPYDEEEGWRGVNVNYGKFCVALAKAMNRPDPEEDAKNFEIILLNTLPGPIDGQLELAMSPELVLAAR